MDPFTVTKKVCPVLMLFHKNVYLVDGSLNSVVELFQKGQSGPRAQRSVMKLHKFLLAYTCMVACLFLPCIINIFCRAHSVTRFSCPQLSIMIVAGAFFVMNTWISVSLATRNGNSFLHK
jgi:hypothetical protein